MLGFVAVHFSMANEVLLFFFCCSSHAGFLFILMHVRFSSLILLGFFYVNFVILVLCFVYNIACSSLNFGLCTGNG